MDSQRRYNRACDLVLNFEDIMQVTIECLGPDVLAGLRANELCGHSQSVTRLADTTFEYVRNTQLSGDRLESFGPSLEVEGRSPRDHPQGRCFPEQFDQLLRQAVGEILLILSFAHVDEREYYDGLIFCSRVSHAGGGGCFPGRCRRG